MNTAIERTMPHNADIERSLFAILLAGQKDSHINQVRNEIETPLKFYVRDHRIMYLAILDLDDRDIKIEASAVSDFLATLKMDVALDRLRQLRIHEEAGTLNQLNRAQKRKLYGIRPEDKTDNVNDSALLAVGGFSTLVDMAGTFAPTSQLSHYCSQISDYYEKRLYIKGLDRLAEKAYLTNDTSQDLINEASELVLELGNNQKTEHYETIDQVAQKAKQTLANRHNKDSKQMELVKTGYPALDELLIHLRPGGYYIVAARPGVGKTTLALNLLQNISSDQSKLNHCLFFSLEMESLDLMNKLACKQAKVDFKDYELGNLSKETLVDVNNSLDEIGTWNASFNDNPSMNMAAIRNEAKRRKLELGGNLKAIFIDYVQLIDGQNKQMESEYERISYNSRAIKKLAKELGVPVIVLAQLKRPDNTTNKPPGLADLKGSGSLEQDADAVIFLHNVTSMEDKNKNLREMHIIVEKNRFGPLKTLEGFFNTRLQEFIIDVEEEGYDLGETSRPIQTGVNANEDLFEAGQFR